MKPFVIYSCVQDDKKAALDAKARLDTLKDDRLKKAAAAKVDSQSYDLRGRYGLLS
jgi:hypothetical protein